MHNYYINFLFIYNLNVSYENEIDKELKYFEKILQKLQKCFSFYSSFYSSKYWKICMNTSSNLAWKGEEWRCYHFFYFLFST